MLQYENLIRFSIKSITLFCAIISISISTLAYVDDAPVKNGNISQVVELIAFKNKKDIQKMFVHKKNGNPYYSFKAMTGVAYSGNTGMHVNFNPPNDKFHEIEFGWKFDKPQDWSKYKDFIMHYMPLDKGGSAQFHLNIYQQDGAIYQVNSWTGLKTKVGGIGDWQQVVTKLSKARLWKYGPKDPDKKSNMDKVVGFSFMFSSRGTSNKFEFMLDAIGLGTDNPEYQGPTITTRTKKIVRIDNKPFMIYYTKPEEPITLAILPTSKLTEKIKVKVEAKDYTGKVLNKTVMYFDPQNTNPQKFTFAGTGHLQCRAVIVDKNGKELYESVRGVTALEPFSPADLKENPDSIFGSWMGRTDRMHHWGIKWDRLMPTGVTKTGDNYTIRNTGKPYIFSKTKGVNKILCFREMPKSLSSKPNRSDFGRYPPKDWDKYGDWISWFVRNNKHNIKIYEVWNEPAASNFWAPRDMKSLVKLHEVTYKAIKKADPEATVLGPCPYSFLFDHIESFLKQEGAKWIDGLVVHAYMDNDPDRAEFDKNIDKCHRLLAKYGKKCNIYITEMGYHPDHFTEYQRACNLVRTFLLAIDKKVKVILWYKWWDYSKELPNRKNPARWAIVRFDYSPTPAATAMRNMISLLENAKYQRRLELSENKRGFEFLKNGHHIRVIYDISDKFNKKSFYRFKSKAPQLTIIDMVGCRKVIKADKSGYYNVELTNAPVYIVFPKKSDYKVK